MDGQDSFGTHGIGTIPGEVNRFDDLARKGRFGVFLNLQVIFVEVRTLQLAVETFKGRDEDPEGKRVFLRVDQTEQMVRFRTDDLRRIQGRRRNLNRIQSLNHR